MDQFPNCDAKVAIPDDRFTSIRDIQSLATNVLNPPQPAEPISTGTPMWYHDTTHVVGEA